MHVRKALHACLAATNRCWASTLASRRVGQPLPLSSRAEVGRRSQWCRSRCTGSEYDGAASTAPRAPSHHRAAAAAVLPALAARALRVVAPAAVSGRGGLWSEARRAHLVGTFTFRLTVALGAAARDSATFCRASHWGEFSAIHCSASFSHVNIAPSISCLRACPHVTKATQPRRFDRGEASK